MNEEQKEPTEEGKKRYSPDGYYRDHPTDGERYPCLCTEECMRPCKGECGCPACDASYNDYLSGTGDW